MFLQFPTFATVSVQHESLQREQFVKCPVHSHWARLGWFWCLPSTQPGKMSALSKQSFGEGDRWILFWQPVRSALGPSWTTSDLPSWHRENVNSQFSICLGNYQFWSKSFWYAGLWVWQMDFDTSILSSAWPGRLMSEERKNQHHSEKVAGQMLRQLFRRALQVLWSYYHFPYTNNQGLSHW